MELVRCRGCRDIQVERSGHVNSHGWGHCAWLEYRGDLRSRGGVRVVDATEWVFVIVLVNVLNAISVRVAEGERGG